MEPYDQTGFGSIVQDDRRPHRDSCSTAAPQGTPGRNPDDRETRPPGETVVEAQLGDAATFLDAAGGRRRRIRPGPRSPLRSEAAIQQLGRLVERTSSRCPADTREIGKPIRESRARCRRSSYLTFFLGEGRRLYGQTVPSEMPDKQLFTFRVPVGVAGIVTAGNFPVAVPSWYIVPALLCGNAVLWKPAEYTPATAEAFSQLILHAGFPRGAFQLVLADGPQTFEGIERALDGGALDKVGFTGSTEVGSRIGELCGRHLQSPCLELGGKNPLVVMRDADLDLAAEGALFSGFGTAGQRCTSLGTAIVHRDVHDDFIARFTKAATDAPIGDPSEDVLYGPMISARFSERYERWLELIRPHHTASGSRHRRSSMPTTHDRLRGDRRRALLPPVSSRLDDRGHFLGRNFGRSWASPRSTVRSGYGTRDGH